MIVDTSNVERASRKRDRGGLVRKFAEELVKAKVCQSVRYYKKGIASSAAAVGVEAALGFQFRSFMSADGYRYYERVK